MVIISSCQDKNISGFAKVTAYVPSSVNEVNFSLDGNKISKHSFILDDGKEYAESIIYSVKGEDVCYQCSSDEKDLAKCSKIPCPVKPDCKRIACGPLTIFQDDLVINGKEQEAEIEFIFQQ